MEYQELFLIKYNIYLLFTFYGETGWATATQLNIFRIGGPNWEETHMLSNKLCWIGQSHKACWTHLSHKACGKSILWLIMPFARHYFAFLRGLELDISEM